MTDPEKNSDEFLEDLVSKSEAEETKSIKKTKKAKKIKGAILAKLEKKYEEAKSEPKETVSVRLPLSIYNLLKTEAQRLDVAPGKLGADIIIEEITQ